MSWSRVVPAALALCLLAACGWGSESGQPPTIRQNSTTTSPTETATSDPALAVFYDQLLHWTSCHRGLQCAKVRVPVD